MKILKVDNFTGGISEGTKRGYVGSFNDGLGLDFRTDPDKLGVMPKLKLDYTPSLLITNMITQGANVWMCGNDLGSTAIIYRRIAGAYTSIAKGGYGLEYFKGSIWSASKTALLKITNPDTANLSGTTDIYDNYFVTPDELIYKRGVTDTLPSPYNSYTLGTSISENADKKCSILFNSSRVSGVPSPYIKGIVLYVITKGTGSWTLILHDASNVSLGQTVITNASLADSSALRMIFSSIQESTVDHFHIVSSVADGTVGVATAADFSTLIGGTLQVMTRKDWDQSKPLPDVTAVDVPATTAASVIKLTEDDREKIKFVPTKSSLVSVGILMSQIYANGASKDLVCELHDENNKVIASNSIAITPTTVVYRYYYQNFTLNATVIPGANYHLHIYQSGTGTIIAWTVSKSTGYTGDSYFYETYSVLESDILHPMKVFTNKLCIGNGQHLATLDDSEIYDSEALTFPEDEKVRCLETVGDYLAISTWKNNSLSTSSKGRIYFWDGTSTTYNSFVDVDGQVNAMRVNKNILYIIHGNQNTISVYSGGITLLRRIKYIGQIKSVYVGNHAIDVWENLLIWGLAGGDSPIDHAIYTLGKKNKDYALALNKDFLISTGNYGSTVTIGSILAVNHNTLYIAWSDGTTGSTVYGIDTIDTTNQEDNAYVQLLRFDGERANTYKISKAISIRTEPLEGGQSVEIWYRLDNNGDFQYLGELNNSEKAGVYYKSFAFDKRWFEVEIKAYLRTTTATAPKLISMELYYDEKYEYQLDSQQA